MKLSKKQVLELANSLNAMELRQKPKDIYLNCIAYSFSIKGHTTSKLFLGSDNKIYFTRICGW